MKSHLDLLNQRIVEIIALLISSDKIPTITGIFMVVSERLHNRVKDEKTEKEIFESFKPFVSNIMSVIETLDISESQFKSVRRLILNEIYSCRDEIVKLIEVGNGTVSKNK